MRAQDVQVRDPFLQEMARLTHSEYVATGHSDLDVRDVHVRDSDPTVLRVGSDSIGAYQKVDAAVVPSASLRCTHRARGSVLPRPGNGLW
jgi:hypothetical protein